MNIITLLESVSLDKSKIGSFSREEYTQIKKLLVAHRENDFDIQDSDIAQLLKAIKSYAEPFQSVLNNRVLYNFFAQKEYSRNYFTDKFTAVEPEKVKVFLQLFFGQELISFFSQNLEANQFEEISRLAEADNYFPENLSFMLQQHSLDKLDDAIAALKPPYGNLFEVLYIKDPYFFTFLSHIKNEHIEQRVKDLSDLITNVYKQDYNSELANKTFLAMNKYIAFDADFIKIIKSNKDIADAKFEAHIPKKRNLTWIYFVIGAIIFIRIAVFFSMNDFDKYNNENTYDQETENKPERKKIDRYYTNMRYTIDSFQVFLADYKESEIRQLTRDISIKTGENPFETCYQNDPTGDSTNYIRVKNNTPYDLVLLENTVLYDTIKIPRTAHFIKAGDALEVNFSRADSQTVFNVYLGKKWGTFQTNSKHLFIRNHSVVEYRFSELIPDAKEILQTDYRLTNDAVISYSNDGLDIDSKNARINSLKEHKE